jgi:signal transduction histidine kinase
MAMWIAWIFLGALLAGPLCGWLVFRRCRRTLNDARRMRRRASGQEHLAQVGKLVGGLAHEIKNPLSTIHLNLTLLNEDLREYDDEEHQRLSRRLERVNQEAERLQGILEDFLRFAGNVELQLRTEDLNSLVGELADFFAPQAEAAHVLLRTSLSDTPVRCRIDVNLIKQAVLNLMINAVQAMTDGGELMLHVRSEGEQGVIEVVDTGPGIPEEARAKIFDIYYSTKKDGSGLGLPTTRRIIHEHHGHLNVESEEGCGTRFRIELPRADDAPAE